MWRHRVMLLNPRYGRVGLLAFPYFFFLEVFGPIIEGLGYVTFLIAVILDSAAMREPNPSVDCRQPRRAPFVTARGR